MREFVVVASLLIVGRRFLDIFLFEWTIRRLVRMRTRATTHTSPPPHILLLIPLIREAPLIAQICHWVARMKYSRSHLRVALVTTEREGGPDAESSTAAAIRHVFARGVDDSLIHLHCPDSRPLRAAQLNWALRQLADAYETQDATYVGVYNADSLPDEETLMLLASIAGDERACGRPMPSAFQQPCYYQVPITASSATAAMPAAAAFQTFWTIAHFTRRLLRSEMVHRSSGRMPSVPVGFLGHGEFVRLDILAELGGFPDYGYADGLLLGWDLAFRGHQIRALPAFDRGEVPPTLVDLHAQHEAWFVGLLNLRLALSRAPSGSRRNAMMATRRWASTVFWALRSPAFVVLLGISLYLGVTPTIYAACSVLLYGAVPMIWLNLRGPLLAPNTPGQVVRPWRLRQLVAAASALLVDGVALWVVLYRVLFGQGIPTPARTVRCHDKL